MNPILALAILLPLAIEAHRLGAVTRAGAIAGILLGLGFSLGLTPTPFSVFLLFVVLGSLSTSLGSKRKRELGVAEAREGRRGPLNALANAGAPGLLVLIAGFSGRESIQFDLIACGGLAAVLADTVASEWGQWLGGTPRDAVSFRRVEVGRDGGVTLVGLLASLLAAFIAGLVVLIWYPVAVLLPVVIAAMAGNYADSLLGSLVEPKLGRHGGAIVNLAAALVGMFVVDWLV